MTPIISTTQGAEGRTNIAGAITKEAAADLVSSLISQNFLCRAMGGHMRTNGNTSLVQVDIIVCGEGVQGNLS